MALIRFIKGTLLFLVFSSSAYGQLNEHMYSSRPLESEVVRLSGLNIGFMPKIRVVTPQQLGGIAQMSAELASDGDEISQARRGVVYNYSMRAYGLISGEIAFSLKPGATVGSLSFDELGSPRPLGPPGVFVLTARSGTELQRAISLLYGSSSVKWVEMSVQYVNQEIE